MPQDSRRSVVYRSFVTCDDPKGVVECGTFRRSKNSSQKLEHKIVETRKMPKNPNSSLASIKAGKGEMISKGIVEEPQSPCSFQLLEVSGRAQKLNQMIDSWSKGMNNGGQSKDIAKDLLKGTLDLQESLVMLGKLQEASQFMAQLKKKHKEKPERERIHESGIGKTTSCRFGDRNYPMGFQKPRLSADCVEEIKKAVRDGLARQNLLPNKAAEENAWIHRRTLDSASDIASTSSSQSSSVPNNSFSSMESPLLLTAPQKGKSPNLIAKLMGLEEVPSKPLQNNEKMSNLQKPIFDIDMPKVRKPQSVIQKESSDQRTLKEVLETMQFQGLLKRKSTKEQKSRSNDSQFKKSLIDDVHPIVLIKPRSVRWPESKGPFEPTMADGQGPKTNIVFRKKEVNCKETPIFANKMSRKSESEETPIKRLGHEEVANGCNLVVLKPEENMVTQQNSSSKVKAASPISNQPHKRESVHRKSDKTPKETVISRNNVQKDVVKSKSMPKSQDQAKVTPKKLGKRENGPTVIRKQVPVQQVTTPNTIVKRMTQRTINRSNDHTSRLVKKEKPVNEPTEATLNMEDQISEEAKIITLTCEVDSALSENSLALPSKLPDEPGRNAYEFQTGEHFNNSQTSPSEVFTRMSECQTNPNSVEQDDYHISHIIRECKNFKSESILRNLLSMDPHFIRNVEELFNLKVNGPSNSQTFSLKDTEVSNVKLSIDCANELIELRSNPDSQMLHPLSLTNSGNLRMCISLDQLLDEVCDKVETLQNNSKVAANNPSPDGVHALLERDMMSSALWSGMWDSGWRHGFSVSETEQVAHDIEKQLFTGLIEEIFA